MLKANEFFRAKANEKKKEFIQQYLSGKLKNYKDFWNDFERLTEGLPRDINDTNIIFNHLCRSPKSYTDIAKTYADHKKKELADLLVCPELTKKSENDSLNNKFLLVDSMNSCRQENFEVAEGQLELFKRIAVGYLYIKAQRNQVNHSGDELDMNDIKNILEKYGYSAQPDKIIENIQRFTGMLGANQ